MRVRTSVFALLATLAVAAPASAGQISVEGGVLRVQANDQVDFEAVQESSTFTVYDYGESLEPGAGCAVDATLPLIGSSDGTTITCEDVTASVHATVTAPDGTGMFFSTSLPLKYEGGPGGDYLSTSGSGAVAATGGAGDDRLRGGSGNDVLDGGDGDDSLSDGGGVDRLTGGVGDDSLEADSSGEGCCFEGPESPAPTPTGTADVLDGGPGKDFFIGLEPVDVMTGGEGRDRAYMFAAGPLAVTLGPGGMDVESVTVERADATVRGNTSVNEIITGEGKDDVDPGAGFDTVDTGKGDDRVNVRDGFPDLVSCGEGADAVVADTQDEVESNCEAVDRAAIAPPATPGAPVAAGLIAPTDLQISARRSGRNTILRGRLMLPAGASAALCDGGGITLKVGKRRIGTTLNAKCAFTVKLKGRVKRSKVKAYFAGTPALAPVTR